MRCMRCTGRPPSGTLSPGSLSISHTVSERTVSAAVYCCALHVRLKHLYTHTHSSLMTVCTHIPDFFISLQKKSQEEGGRLQGTDLVKYSRCYRSILHECVLGLHKLARGEY